MGKLVRQPNQVKYVSLGAFEVNDDTRRVFRARAGACILVLGCFVIGGHLDEFALEVE